MSSDDELPENLDFTRSDEVVYGDPSKEKLSPEERKAVALEYDEEDDEAPRVTAKGEGNVAEKIIELAEREDVPLYEDEDLVQLLYGLDLDEQIPPSLYEVVAEVFAFLYRLNEEQADDDSQ